MNGLSKATSRPIFPTALGTTSLAIAGVAFALHAASATSARSGVSFSSHAAPPPCAGKKWTWPFNGCGSFSGAAVSVTNAGDGIDAGSTNGSAGKFVNSNASNGNAPVYATTASTNSAVYATSVGALSNQQQGAVTAFSTNGNGVYGFSNNASGGAFQSDAGNGIAALYVRDDNANGDLFYATNTSAGGTAYIDPKGNMTISGILTTSGSCHNGCDSVRQRVVSYAARESLPTMEDVGEGRLTGGLARIRIDSAFGAATDLKAGYAVFVSPEGPNRGLYVTEKTPDGFTVAENPGGRSTLAFSYRLVARPFGIAARRLPVVSYAAVSPLRQAPAQTR